MSMISLEPELQRIGDCLMVCDCCGWEGTVYECIPDVDWDGALGCPICVATNNIGDDLHEKVQQTEIIFRRLSNQDIQVILNNQFLFQFRHQETWPVELEFTEAMRITIEALENIRLAGKNAAQAAEDFRNDLKKQGF